MLLFAVYYIWVCVYIFYGIHQASHVYRFTVWHTMLLKNKYSILYCVPSFVHCRSSHDHGLLAFGIRCRFSALTTIVEIYKCSDRMWRWSNVFFLISFSESSRWIWYYLGIVCCPFNVHFFHQASIWRLFVILYIGILLFFYFINFTLFEMWYILRIFYSPRNIVT